MNMDDIPENLDDWSGAARDLFRTFAAQSERDISDRFEEGKVDRDAIIKQATYRHNRALWWLSAAKEIHSRFGTEYREVEPGDEFDVHWNGGSQFHLSTALQMLIHEFNDGVKSRAKHTDGGGFVVVVLEDDGRL